MNKDEFEICVKLTPRSSRNKLELQPDGSLRAWVTSAPTDGQANESLCETVAKHLHIGKTSVTIISGQTNRNKRLKIVGAGFEDLKKGLAQ